MLIINNAIFHDSSRNRQGTEKDVAALKQLFTGLKFDVDQRDDLTAQVSVFILFAKEDFIFITTFYVAIIHIKCTATLYENLAMPK